MEALAILCATITPVFHEADIRFSAVHTFRLCIDKATFVQNFTNSIAILLDSMERHTGFEPVSPPWKGSVLPLHQWRRRPFN